MFSSPGLRPLPPSGVRCTPRRAWCRQRPLCPHTLWLKTARPQMLWPQTVCLFLPIILCLYWNLHIPVGYLWYFNFLTFKLLIIFYLDYLYLSICSSSFSPIKSYFGKFKTIATLSRNEYSYPHQLYHMHISSLFQYNLLILCFFKCNFSVLTHAKVSQ